MTSLRSTTDFLFRIARFGGEGGSAAVSFGLIVPILVSLTAGVIEISLIAFDYHRAGEAARRAVRQASMLGPIADMTAVENGGTITCTFVAGEGGGVTCGTATILDSTIFTKVVDSVKQAVPHAKAENVEITYEPSGLGDPDTPVGILPVLRLRLTGFEHRFLMMSVIPGLGEGIDLPAVEASSVANSVDSAAS